MYAAIDLCCCWFVMLLVCTAIGLCCYWFVLLLVCACLCLCCYCFVLLLVCATVGLYCFLLALLELCFNYFVNRMIKITYKIAEILFKFICIAVSQFSIKR